MHRKQLNQREKVTLKNDWQSHVIVVCGYAKGIPNNHGEVHVSFKADPTVSLKFNSDSKWNELVSVMTPVLRPRQTQGAFAERLLEAGLSLFFSF